MAVSDWCLTLLSNGHICDIYLTLRFLLLGIMPQYFLKTGHPVFGHGGSYEIFIIVGNE
jgi:hypothetical protein